MCCKSNKRSSYVSLLQRAREWCITWQFYSNLHCWNSNCIPPSSTKKSSSSRSSPGWHLRLCAQLYFLHSNHWHQIQSCIEICVFVSWFQRHPQILQSEEGRQFVSILVLNVAVSWRWNPLLCTLGKRDALDFVLEDLSCDHWCLVENDASTPCLDHAWFLKYFRFFGAWLCVRRPLAVCCLMVVEQNLSMPQANLDSLLWLVASLLVFLWMATDLKVNPALYSKHSIISPIHIWVWTFSSYWWQARQFRHNLEQRFFDLSPHTKIHVPLG